jgi:hypothetical protein
MKIQPAKDSHVTVSELEKEIIGLSHTQKLSTNVTGIVTLSMITYNKCFFLVIH